MERDERTPDRPSDTTRGGPTGSAMGSTAGGSTDRVPDDVRAEGLRADEVQSGVVPARADAHPDDVQPLDKDQRDTIEKTSAPLMGAGGAAAGATAGTLILGPVGTGVGAILGALAGAVGGWWAGHSVTDTARYTEEHDQHYQRLHQSSYADSGHAFDRARPAYQLGHLAAHNPEYHRREFHEVEPELRRAWAGDLAAHGEWESVQPYARDAYGHARSTGAGEAMHRDTSVIGTAGSAVDPDELRESLSHQPRHIVDPHIV